MEDEVGFSLRAHRETANFLLYSKTQTNEHCRKESSFRLAA